MKELSPKTQPTFYFIGVTTAQSSIMRLFPRWMAALGRAEVVIEGIDLALNTSPQRYRRVVSFIKTDPNSLGGLVTTHKIDLLHAARDLFDDLDPYAQTCGEVSCLSKRAGQLIGHAKDPLSAGFSLTAMLGPEYFARTGGEVLCFGAGGAATAIALHLINRPNPADRPRKFYALDLAPSRLDHFAAMISRQETDIDFELIHSQMSEQNDQYLAAMPPGSLIINATGMGKDRPGAPITATAQFPQESIVWELNYRGTLEFMHRALAQVDTRQVRVEDGWLYFLHGWTQVIAQVLEMPIEEATFTQLVEIADEMRG